MPIVTETLLKLLRKQIEAHGTVVWYDPDAAYAEVAQSLCVNGIAGAALHCYDPEHGFVWLRHELEPLWANALYAPRLLLYVPLPQAETVHALVEFEVAGVVVRPGQQPLERNTALAMVARRALEPIFPPAKREEIVAEVQSGKLTLAELDEIAEKGSESGAGAIGVIFHTGSPQEIALRFLTLPDRDAEIVARQALDSLSRLLSDLIGVPLSSNGDPAMLRTLLARQVLMTDWIAALGDDAPTPLQTFPIAERSVARHAAVELARAWRNRRDPADSYCKWAGRIQAEMGASGMDVPMDVLLRAETFRGGEERLQSAIEEALQKRATTALVAQAEARSSGFWARQDPRIKTRWQVIVDAGEVLLEAGRIASTLKGKAWHADALVSRYAYGEEGRPWCALESAQRHLERDYYRFDLEPQQHDALMRLVAYAQQQYSQAANDLAGAFTHAYADAEFALPGTQLQVDVYRETVAPAARKGRVAYLLIDALRFEMARELSEMLQADESMWEIDLTEALATPPTVTEVGMAALLPGAETGLTLQETKAGLGAVLGTRPGQALRTRQDRVKHLVEAVEGKVVVTKLGSLAPLRDPRLRAELDAADVVLVTASDEIDRLCESNPSLARRMLDDIFTQLRRGLKALFARGIETAVVTADHGYLFGENLAPGQTIDAPGGQTIDAPGGQTVTLKRRAWLGRGGMQSDSFLRRPLSALGIGGDLEMATPWNLSAFKVPGGGTQYYHGGLSLPEIVIPVLVVRSGAAPSPPPGAPIEWTLVPGTPSVSNRFFSVIVKGQTSQLLPLEPPLVRVEMRAGGQPISVPVSASYGYRDPTRDVQLAQQEDDPRAVADNTVTLMITDEPPVDRVDVYLLDATTGVTLARLEALPFKIVEY
jgi:hypothetical protein